MLQEEVKGLAFGGANPNFNLLGQVIEAVAKPPSAPTNVSIQNYNVNFAAPEMDGGTKISHYEIHISCSGTNIPHLCGNY